MPKLFNKGKRSFSTSIKNKQGGLVHVGPGAFTPDLPEEEAKMFLKSYPREFVTSESADNLNKVIADPKLVEKLTADNCCKTKKIKILEQQLAALRKGSSGK